jgi:hypothetical protein
MYLVRLNFREVRLEKGVECLDWEDDLTIGQIDRIIPAFLKNNPEDILRSLLNCSAENQKTVLDSLESNFVEKINNGNEGEAHLILEVTTIEFSPRFTFSRKIQTSPENLKNFIDIRKHIFE